MKMAIILLVVLSRLISNTYAVTLEESEFGAILSFPLITSGSLYNQAYDVGVASYGPQIAVGITGVLVLPQAPEYNLECPGATQEALGTNPYINALPANTDFVLLVDRGGCPFVEKIDYAEQMGASAVIVCDWAVREVTTMGSARTDITIPSVLLQNVNCISLMAHLGVQNWDPVTPSNMIYPSAQQITSTSVFIQWLYDKTQCGSSPETWCYAVNIAPQIGSIFTEQVRIWDYGTVNTYFDINFNVIGTADCNTPEISFIFRDIDNAQSDERLIVSDSNGQIAACQGTANKICADWLTCFSNTLLPITEITAGDSYTITVRKPAQVNEACDDIFMDAKLTMTCYTDTFTPTNDPTHVPSNAPSHNPTAPTNYPTESPSNHPTKYPTSAPTNQPSNMPTSTPSDIPSNDPSNTPTNDPSRNPSKSPTEYPSAEPSSLSSGNVYVQTMQETETETDIEYNSPNPLVKNSFIIFIVLIISFLALCICCSVIIFWVYKLNMELGEKRKQIQSADRMSPNLAAIHSVSTDEANNTITATQNNIGTRPFPYIEMQLNTAGNFMYNKGIGGVYTSGHGINDFNTMDAMGGVLAPPANNNLDPSNMYGMNIQLNANHIDMANIANDNIDIDGEESYSKSSDDDMWDETQKQNDLHMVTKGWQSNNVNIKM